jgi:transposase-like protein
MGRRVKAMALIVPPQIEAQGDLLVWGSPVPGSLTRVMPSDRLISDFLKLGSPTSMKPFVKFAKRYGVFGATQLLDWEKVPVSLSDALVLGKERWEVLGCIGTEWEPIEFWRVLSGVDPPSDNVWTQFAESAEEREWPPAHHLWARSLLAKVVNHWLRVGRVRLSISLSDLSKPPVSWETQIVCGDIYSTLFGTIALQVMLLIAGAETLYTCNGCGIPYIPAGRRPRRGQNSYCDDCGLDRARRDADRRRKDKMIEARRLHAKGAKPEEIADRLNVRSVASVRRWLKKGRSNVKKTRTR